MPEQLTDYSLASWHPNPNRAPRASTQKIDRVIIHDTEGTFIQSVDWMAQVGTSAHYIISSGGDTSPSRVTGGLIWQLVRERDVAYHAGNLEYNKRSIGIEHEGYATAATRWYTPAMMLASAKLVAGICRRYTIPIDRAHIIGHNEVPDPDHVGQFGGMNHHTDPGAGWDWANYINLITMFFNPPPASPNPFNIPPATWVLPYLINLAVDGWPIAAPYQAVLGDGKSYTVQAFERVWFALASDGKVSRMLIGSELYQLKGGIK